MTTEGKTLDDHINTVILAKHYQNAEEQKNKIDKAKEDFIDLYSKRRNVSKFKKQTRWEKIRNHPIEYNPATVEAFDRRVKNREMYNKERSAKLEARNKAIDTARKRGDVEKLNSLGAHGMAREIQKTTKERLLGNIQQKQPSIRNPYRKWQDKQKIKKKTTRNWKQTGGSTKKRKSRKRKRKSRKKRKKHKSKTKRRRKR